MGLPDVVYLVRDGDRNEELRFSLRSLVNLPHRHVWFAGHRPSWADVRHIYNPQGGSKWRNQARNLRAACEHPDVSETFVMFNDDFFVTHPIDEVPTLHHGPLSAMVAGKTARRNDYMRRMIDTSELCGPQALAYDMIHVPMVFEKAKMLQVLDEIGNDLLFRSVYGNRWKVGGVEHPNVKIAGGGDKPDLPPPFVSTSTGAFRKGPVGRRLRRQFPAPCRHEQ